jgi:hypothetical protein
MVVLTNNHRNGHGYRSPLLVRACKSCRESKWQSEFENPYVKRCRDCHDRITKSPCRHCGGPSGGLHKPRLFCDKPECVQARLLHVGRASGVTLHARVAGRTSKVCTGCGEDKPETAEFFTPSRRDPDGTIRKFSPYCRPCASAEWKDRYHRRIKDPEYLAKERARRQVLRDRERERRDADPEYAAAQRARYREYQRQSVARKKAKQQAPKPTSGSGPEMIAWPLMDAIEAALAREGIDEEAMAFRLGTNCRRFSDWRKPGRKTRMSLVDKALLGLGLEWDQVYPPMWFPEIAKHWSGR